MKAATLTVSILLLCAPLASSQERLTDKLQKGIVQEEANQNLDKAIEAYRGILAQFDEDRKVAATALFRLAECYRKTGKSEDAVQAYQRLVREFPDQQALAQSGRDRLANDFGITARKTPPVAAERRTRDLAAADAIAQREAERRQQDQITAAQAAALGTARREQIRAQEADRVERIRDLEQQIRVGEARMATAQRQMALTEEQIRDFERRQSVGTVDASDPRLASMKRDLIAQRGQLQELEIVQSDLRQRLADARRMSSEAGVLVSRGAGKSEPSLERRHSDAVRIGQSGVQPPVATKEVPPTYPEIARSAKVKGSVECEILVGADGKVADARVVRSIPLLDQAALDAVRQWQFRPGTIDGKPVPVIMTVPVEFK